MIIEKIMWSNFIVFTKIMDCTETENDCHNFGSPVDMEDDFYLKQNKAKVPRYKRCIRKDSKGWNIEKQRLLQMQKLFLMEIPERTKHVLSKLLVNHQITDIGRVIKIRRNCVTIAAKVNLENANYKDLFYEDVRLKIFTKNNHTRPDLETAKDFIQQLRLRERRKLPDPEQIYFYNNFMYPAFEESLFIMRIDSIVVTKCNRTAPRLLILEDVLKKKSYMRVGILEALKQILNIVKASRENDYLFWNQLTSMRNIFYRKDTWEIIYNKQGSSRSSQHKQSLKNFTENIAALVNIFHRYGASMDDIKYECYKAFKSKRRGFSHVLSQLKNKFGWSWPCFIDHYLK